MPDVAECICSHYETEHDRTSPRRCRVRYSDELTREDGEVIARHHSTCDCPGFEPCPDDDQENDDA
jgi:hemin uptake protein HemP